jgi:parallel beta-helix repeat protein
MAPLNNEGRAAGVFKGALETCFIQGCNFKRLHISGIGGQGIRMHDSRNNTLTQCEIRSVGAGGIYNINGNGNRLTHNRVNSIGKIYASAMGICIYGSGQQSFDNEVSNNIIFDTPYTGIECSGWKNCFEGNLVYNVMSILRDGAAFYGQGKDNIIIGNIVRDIPFGKGARAYYVDEFGHGFLIKDNLAVNCEEPFLMHMAKACNIQNNIFINRGIVKLRFPGSNDIKMDRNIIIADGQIHLMDSAAVTTWTNNLFFSRAGKYSGIPMNVKKSDPGFVDVAKMDYRFQANSSALKLGIRPLNFSNVGPQQKTRNDLDEK